MPQTQPHTEDIDNAVLAVYDAALGARDWSEVLREIGSHVGTMHEKVCLIDLDTMQEVAARVGRGPELDDYWRREWAATRRCLRLKFLERNRKPFAVDYDYIDETGIRRSEYYDDLTAKFDFSYYVGGHIPGLIPGKPNITVAFCFGYDRRHGHVQAADLRLASRFLPHLKRAFTIERLLYEKGAQEKASQHFAASAGGGVITVDAQGCILSLSPIAEQLIEKKDGLHRRNGRLSACLHSDASTLRSLIRQMAQIDPRNPPATSTMAVHRAGGKLPLLLTIAPLSFRSAEFLNVLSAGAIVYVSDPEAEQTANAQALTALFKLTETEAQIAAFFIRGMNVDKIARHSGTTPATVRFHFRNIFRKCNASGQVDLMRILKSSLIPLSSERRLQ